MEARKTQVSALIVDDEIDICFLLSGILKNSNLDCRCVNSLAEAKKALAHFTPNILIIDNHLPDGLGLNFIRQVKENYPSVRIIMITAHDTYPDKQAALKEGVDSFIGKPFSRATISSTVDRLIN